MSAAPDENTGLNIKVRTGDLMVTHILRYNALVHYAKRVPKDVIDFTLLVYLYARNENIRRTPYIHPWGVGVGRGRGRWALVLGVGVGVRVGVG